MNSAWRLVGLTLMMGLILVACGQEPQAPEAPEAPALIAPETSQPAVSQPSAPSPAAPAAPAPVEAPAAEAPQAAEPQAAAAPVQSEPEPEEEAPVEEPAVAVVEWNELDELNLVTERWVYLMEGVHPDDRHILVERVVDAVTEVIEGDVPAGVENSRNLELFQEDLSSAAEMLEIADQRDDQAQIDGNVATIRRLVSELGEAAAAPPSDQP